MQLPEKDRRRTPRRTVALDLTVQAGGQLALPGKTRDISMGGLFVETQVAWLPTRSPVFIAFDIVLDGQPHHQRLPARVDRMTEHGAALTFGEFHGHAVHALRRLVYAQPVAVPAAVNDRTDALIGV